MMLLISIKNFATLPSGVLYNPMRILSFEPPSSGLAEDRVDKLSERAPDSLKISILDTLTSMAVHDEYQDAVEEGKIALPMQVDENPSTNGGSFEGSFDRSATDLVGLIDPLNKVLSKNDIPLLTDDVTNDDICAAIGILEARICRGDKNGESDQRMGEGALDIAKLPIGIELSEDEQGLHMPVVILRLSHNYNMREFQSGINETINALQQYTADPKTDSALGRVGGR